MLKVRLIPCLDVKDGRVVKGVQFVDLRDAGDPVEAAKAYDAAGADELCFLDITASHEARGILLDVVRRTAEACFMPLTVGGGVRTVEDIRKLLLAGADKVSINTAAVKNPRFRARGGGEIRQPMHRRRHRRQEGVGDERASRVGRSSPMAAATPPASTPSPSPGRWRSSAQASCWSPPWTGTAPRAATISRSSAPLRMRSPCRSSPPAASAISTIWSTASRRPCQRRSGRLDLPFRHAHDRGGEELHGGEGLEDAAGRTGAGHGQSALNAVFRGNRSRPSR